MRVPLGSPLGGATAGASPRPTEQGARGFSLGKTMIQEVFVGATCGRPRAFKERPYETACEMSFCVTLIRRLYRHLPPGEGKSTGPPLSHTNGAGAPWGLSSRAVPPSRAPNHSFLKVFGILKGLQTSPQANLPRSCEEVFKKPLSRRRHALSFANMHQGSL